MLALASDYEVFIGIHKKIYARTGKLRWEVIIGIHKKKKKNARTGKWVRSDYENTLKQCCNWQESTKWLSEYTKKNKKTQKTPKKTHKNKKMLELTSVYEVIIRIQKKQLKKKQHKKQCCNWQVSTKWLSEYIKFKNKNKKPKENSAITGK